MNTGSFILPTFLAAILPPMKMPPVVIKFKAQFPVSAPNTLTKIDIV